MSSEFERIARIRAALDRETPGTLTANGDDAAVFDIERPTAVSVDSCIEHTHFESAWLSLQDVGWRSQVAALSDLTAMGATARYVLVALAAPKEFSDSSLDALCSGIGEALDKAGAALIGGNLSASGSLSITTTAIGELCGKSVVRSGAHPGERLYVTGTLGAAGAGLSALLAGELDAKPIAAWRRPPLRTELAPQISACASACIDISDGLGQDLEHLARASNVGFVVHAEKLPLAECVSANAAGYLQAWESGEEYELLFTASKEPNFEARHIGFACKEPGVRLLLGDEPLTTSATRGFDHFR